LCAKQDISWKSDQGSDRRFLRWLVLAVSGFLLLPLSAFVFLHLPWVQKRVIGKVTRPVEKTAGVQIELESYRWSSFSRMQLTSLQVMSNQKDFLRCDQAQLSFRISTEWPYLIPKVLLLDKPVLYLEKDARGKWRIPRAAGTAQKAGEASNRRTARRIAFPWPEVRINSGQIIAFQEGHVVLSLQNVTGSLFVKTSPGDDGPILSINLGQGQGNTDVSSWLGFSGVGAAK